MEWLGDELVAEFPAGSELMRISLSGNRAPDLARLVNAVTDAYLDEVVSKDHNDRQETARQLDDLLRQYNEKLAVQPPSSAGWPSRSVRTTRRRSR